MLKTNVEKSSEKAVIYTENNIIHGVNNEFIQLTGYKYNDIIGKSLTYLGELLRSNFQMSIQNIETKHNLYIFRNNDLPIEVKVTCDKLIDGNRKVYSFEKEIDSTLEWVLYNFDNININKDDSMAIFSYPDCILLKNNKKYIDTLCSMNIIFDDIIGKYPSFPSNILNLFKQGTSLHECEVECINSDGIATYWDINFKILYLAKNKKYLLSYFYDVTERVEKRKLIEKQKREIELILDNMSDDAEIANEKMEKILRTQEEIFINTSHELKTPLNLIFSASQLMKVLLGKSSLEGIRNNLIHNNQTIIQNCYRLTKIVNNILDISKIEAGFENLNLCNHNIIDVIDHIVQSVSDYMKSKNLQIVFNTEVQGLIIALDVYKFQRILLNLISNAIKFSNSDGEIFIKLVKKHDTIEISVKDNGIGIDNKNLDIIFEKFMQINTSLSRISEGTGLGLPLVKAIVELHGGSINVESQLGHGSTFTIRLPITTLDNINISQDEYYSKDKVEMIKFEFSDIYS